MRKILLILLFSATLLFAQSKELFNESVEESGAYTDTSPTFYADSDVPQWGKFNGIFGFVLDVDSASTRYRLNTDSLAFFPEYKVGTTWVRGDTMVWRRCPLTAAEAGWSAYTKLIIPTTHHDWVLTWFSDPTDTTNVQGFPIDAMRVYVKSLHDSIGFDLDLRGHKY